MGLGSGFIDYFENFYADVTNLYRLELVWEDKKGQEYFEKRGYECRRDERSIQPKDLFHLKSLVCAGTDTASYKPGLERAWGIKALEICAGTEPTLIATETWNHNGMVFFPDACFYEFIPEEEMNRNLEDPSYVPRTLRFPVSALLR